ncbi:MAG: TIR domain-containing protein, partial [Thermoanaerobaculia bacterium]
MSRNGAFEYDVFVSHNSRDKPRVSELAERLREAGLRVWYDDWILTAGSNIYLEIERGIEASRTLALCMSSHAFDSDWVDLERSTVLFRDPANRGRSFIPILLDDCDIPDTLRRYKYVDYRHDSEEAVQELVAACGRVAEPGTPAPAAPPAPEPERLAGARPTATTHLFLGHLPATGRDLFGRERELRQLDEALADPQIHVCVLAAWGGAGKSTLVNHWVRRIAEEPSPPRIYAWSFHRQGTAGGLTSADLFMESALKWFGDPDPGQGSSWARGERLARLVRKQPTLLLLDGLEPLQWPPGPDEGKLKDPAVTALLRVLATRNSGLCVITSRLSVSDLEDCYGSTVLEINLRHVEPEAGAMILKAQGARGDETQLRQASTEFDGHCLALTILGSYLADAFDGDILRRTEVGPLMEADRHGGQARRIMASYEALLEENQRAVLRLLGLFDRPADAPAIAALRQPPAIAGLTEPLQDVSDREWRKLVAGLRRSQLLAPKNPERRGALDTHPLVREYYSQQLEEDEPEAWRQGNQRLYEHFRRETVELPETVDEMEPLFNAVACGCRAGLESDALNQVLIPRIMRGEEFYASLKHCPPSSLLAVLSKFFKDGDWSLPITADPPHHQGLDDGQQLTVLTYSGPILV